MSTAMAISPYPHPTGGLLDRARSGDRQAFDHLFARFVPRLRWYVSVRMGNELRGSLEPDDVLQETFAAGWAGLGGFEDRGEGSLLRWFFAVAENQMRALANAGKAQRRDRRRSVGGGPADAALALEIDPRTGPCTRAERIELRLRLAQALTELEHDERTALLGRVVEGRALADVAADLGRSESATRRLVAKAASKLGSLIGGGSQA